jgi:WD40 repeat protein
MLAAKGTPAHTVWILDIATGSEQEFGYPTGESKFGSVDSPETVAFSPDGEALAVGRFCGWITLLDLRTGKRKTSFDTNLYESIHMLAFHPDGKSLFSGQRSSVKQFDLATGTETLAFHLGNGDPAPVLSADCKTLASFRSRNQDEAKTIRLFDIPGSK